jgi:methylated-DNA-protein-cysteine methyltransferase-like protein
MKKTFEQFYDVVRQIPYGRVATYGRVASLADSPCNARIVGFAMSGCKDPGVPCHRVVNRFGGLAEAFLPLGRETHRMLLEMEGVEFTPDGNVDLERFMWNGPEGSS